MPNVSLVVCVHGERDLLERLLREAEGCHDDLVVVHDGPDTAGIQSLVEQWGGRFFVRDRAFQQEPHWPFAWAQARHDWILRLDGDEFPGPEMKLWLKQFRAAPAPPAEVSGYMCVWPLWNGRQAVTTRWPNERVFLFHKQRVRFFGMVEQMPLPDSAFTQLGLILCHQPRHGTLGLRNVLLRRQAYVWRTVIARSLQGKPTDLACWRWTSEAWPPGWERIRSRPFRSAAARLLKGTLKSVREQREHEGRILPGAAINGPIHYFLICLEYWYRRQRGDRLPAAGHRNPP